MFSLIHWDFNKVIFIVPNYSGLDTRHAREPLGIDPSILKLESVVKRTRIENLVFVILTNSRSDWKASSSRSVAKLVFVHLYVIVLTGTSKLWKQFENLDKNRLVIMLFSSDFGPKYFCNFLFSNSLYLTYVLFVVCLWCLFLYLQPLGKRIFVRPIFV